MIISFLVKNFRSIKEEAVLNLEAGSKKEHEDNLVTIDKKLRVLKTIGIYGANASGKSNIIKAFTALRKFVIGSYRTKRDDNIPLDIYNPFKLDQDSASSPIRFELEFIANKFRYVFIVEFIEDRIIEEALYFYPAGHKATLYIRKNPTDDENTVKPGSYLDGKSKSISCLKNQLFISRTADENGVSRHLINVYLFIKKTLILDQGISLFSPDIPTAPSLKIILSALLKHADTGINHIEFKERDADSIKAELNLPDSIPESIVNKIIEGLKIQPLFFHGANNVAFERDDESEGTKRLYDIAPGLIDSLLNGRIVIIDEIDSQLHPYIIKFIIDLFNDPQVNTKNAQLIYTTHSVILLDGKNTRRDQVVFTEKLETGNTILYALDEFGIRSNIDFLKYYMDGRFRAVPQINYQKLKEALLNSNEESSNLLEPEE